MKVIPKPIKLVPRQGMSALEALVSMPVPREQVTQRAYEQLVTRQNVDPDRANELLRK